MTDIFECRQPGFTDNPIYRAWHEAKTAAVRESWAKENSHAHWRAMLEETKAECAWMIERYRIENADRVVSETMQLVAEILLQGKTQAVPPAGTAPPSAPAP